MRKINLVILGLMMLFSVLMVAQSVSAADESLTLCQKNVTTWQCLEGGVTATLEYNSVGPTFNYDLHVNDSFEEDYVLIYYADQPNRFVNWGGAPAYELGILTSEENELNGSVDFDSNLPFDTDWNVDPNPNYCDENNSFDDYEHCNGAKIWLVPFSDYNGEDSELDEWNPDNPYLFETDLITYTEDVEGPEITLTEIPSGYQSCSTHPTISADITDESGVKFGSVILYYQYDGYPWDHVSAAWEHTGDSYSIDVDWFTPADGEPFNYYVEASDIFNQIGNNGTEENPYSFIYDCLPPTALINGPTPVDEGVTETYDATGSNDSASDVSFEWDCGNGEGWTSGGLTHDCAWNDDGTYTVSVRVTDGVGNSAVATMEVTVDDLGPTADLTGPTSTNEGVTETYYASNSTSYPDSIVLYGWDCNYDSENPNWVSDGAIHECMWPQEGNYTVAVKVTDDDGSEDVTTRDILVEDSNPTACFTEDPSTITEGESVSFDATCSESYDGITTYCWDFGDGSSEVCDLSYFKITHSYEDDGNYTVTLRVYEADEDMDDTTKLVTVEDTHPIACFTESTHTPNECTDEVNFNASCTTARENLYEYCWDFGDGSSEVCGNGYQTISYSYPEDGKYTVTLSVKDIDDEGYETSTDVKNVQDQGPTAILTGDSQVVTYHSGLYDASESTTPCDDITSYQWDCNYDSENPNWISGTETNDECDFGEEGFYTVAVKVTDEDDSEDVATFEVEVYDYAIDLATGWNLVSIPLVPEDDNTNIGFVFGDAADKAEKLWEYKYDAVEGKNVWNYNEVSADSWDADSNRVQNILPGYGYYILMDEEATIYQNGEKFYGFDNVVPRPPQVDLTPGWNLIGHYGMNDVSKWFEKNDLSGGLLTDLADVTLLDENALPAHMLVPTEGYWAFMTGQNNLLYAPSNADYAEHPEFD